MECIGLVAGKSGDSLTDELHRLGYAVALVGGKESEPGMGTADYICVKDLGEREAIESFFKEHNIAFIVFGTGHVKAIQLAEYLESKGFLTNIDTTKSKLAKDKVLFKEKIESLNLHTPKYVSFNQAFDLDRIVGEIGLPCVVKSVIDFTQPQKANTIEELEAAILEVQSTGTEVLIEKYIPGNDCTVAVVSDGIEVRSLGVIYYCKAKEYQLKGFDGAYSDQLPAEQEARLNLLSETIVRELGFIGLVRVDFIVDGDIPYILELNSIIVTGYKGSAYPFFKEVGIDIGKEMTENSIRIYKNKLNAQ